MATTKIVRIPLRSSTARRLKGAKGPTKTYDELVDELLEAREASRSAFLAEMERSLREDESVPFSAATRDLELRPRRRK